MFHKLKKFSKIDVDIANAATSVLNRHTWYLLEETVPMALFSSKLSNDEKSQLASKILTFEREKLDLKDWKLEKPNLQLDITSSTTLADLVGRKSFLLWDSLGLDHQWLKREPSTWLGEPDFLK